LSDSVSNPLFCLTLAKKVRVRESCAGWYSHRFEIWKWVQFGDEAETLGISDGELRTMLGTGQREDIRGADVGGWVVLKPFQPQAEAPDGPRPWSIELSP
jgi:hypothetical protein